MTINPNYEVASEGGVRHWGKIPYASLENITPTETQPFEIVGTDGLQVTGTILTIDATRSLIVGDMTASMVYRHFIRNVITYNGGAEQNFATIDIGDVVYYDNSVTMPANCFLSLSPLNNLGQANSIFGWVVPADSSDTFPKGAAQAGSTWEQAVMQHGA
jgi:hypothetical protein